MVNVETARIRRNAVVILVFPFSGNDRAIGIRSRFDQGFSDQDSGASIAAISTKPMREEISVIARLLDFRLHRQRSQIDRDFDLLSRLRMGHRRDNPEYDNQNGNHGQAEGLFLHARSHRRLFTSLGAVTDSTPKKRAPGLPIAGQLARLKGKL